MRVRSCDHTLIQSSQASLFGSAEISAGKPGFQSTTGPKLTPFPARNHAPPGYALMAGNGAGSLWHMAEPSNDSGILF